MCTVGYGDIAPINDIEVVLSIVNILMACGVFAHAVMTLFLDCTSAAECAAAC